MPPESENQKAPDNHQRNMESLMHDVTDAFTGGYVPYLIFGTLLEDVGLFRVLTDTGIIPAAENPNPFSYDLEPEYHKEWALDHPEEMSHFGAAFERQVETIRLLFIGTLLGEFIANRPPPSSSDK